MLFFCDVLIVFYDGFGGTAEDIGQRLDVGAFLQGRGNEIVAQVIGAQTTGDTDPDQGFFPGCLDGFDLSALIMDNRVSFFIGFSPGY